MDGSADFLELGERLAVEFEAKVLEDRHGGVLREQQAEIREILLGVELKIVRAHDRVVDLHADYLGLFCRHQSSQIRLI